MIVWGSLPPIAQNLFKKAAFFLKAVFSYYRGGHFAPDYFSSEMKYESKLEIASIPDNGDAYTVGISVGACG